MQKNVEDNDEQKLNECCKAMVPCLLSIVQHWDSNPFTVLVTCCNSMHLKTGGECFFWPPLT